MKAYQRIMRERLAQLPEPDLEKKRAVTAAGFGHGNAWVREITRAQAMPVILEAEWLGTMGTGDFYFGLFFGPYLAGVECFGRVAGTGVAPGVCGPQHAHQVKVLVRGACLHWAHPHSGSFLVSTACRLLARKGFPIVVAYADEDAGEIGTIYQAANFLYTGKPRVCRNSLKTPDGRIVDTRRLKSGGEVVRLPSTRHRYVHFSGKDREELRAALRWPVLPYPKRTEVA